MEQDATGGAAVRRRARFYFVVQGLAVLLWWGILIVRPAARAPFVLTRGGEEALLAFCWPDLALLGPGSLLAGMLFGRAPAIARHAAWFVAGGMAYAAAYCVAASLRSGFGWLASVFMVPAAIWSGMFALATTVEHRMFRPARPRANRAKTWLQIVVIWSLVLGVLPVAIVAIEDSLGFPRLDTPWQRPLACLFFVAASLGGLRSASVMVGHGGGTPLPLAHATRLVVVGPYARVRNPMAVNGIAQALAVALGYGSFLVALYALSGALLWQWILRPLEEDDLRRRFGAAYDDYRAQVRCWRPRRTPYRAPEPVS